MMNRIIDFHTHILPCVDDGSRSLETSVEMLRLEKSQGIDGVVLTPHFYAGADSPKSFLKRISAAEERFFNDIQKYENIPRIYSGAEVHYFDGISDSEYIAQFAVKDTNYIMVEMPMEPWTDRMLRELEGIYIKNGFVPIVAHIDRYIPLMGDKALRKLSELPVVVQANASFFLNIFTRRKALRLLSEEKIHLLGSDCHNLNTRPPNLGLALEIIQKKFGDVPFRFIDSVQRKIIPSLAD